MGMSTLVSSILEEVEADVRRRFSCATPIVSSENFATASPLAYSPSSSSASPYISSTPVMLSLLTPDDWTAVLCPLAPDTQCSAQPSLHELIHYAEVRCAELPMRLRMEALQTRRYEHLLRQHTRELVTLSEYVTLVSRAPPTLTNAAAAPRVAAPAAAGDASVHQQPQQQQSLDNAQLPSDLCGLLAPEEVGRRLERAEERIRELEVMLRQDAEAKVQSCQRMVLLCEYVRALTLRVQREGAVKRGVELPRMKRPRSEADVNESIEECFGG